MLAFPHTTHTLHTLTSTLRLLRCFSDAKRLGFQQDNKTTPAPVQATPEGKSEGKSEGGKKKKKKKKHNRSSHAAASGKETETEGGEVDADEGEEHTMGSAM